MLAAVQTGYGDMHAVLRVEEAPAPKPRADEVLVRVEGSTLNRKDLFALARQTGPGIRRPPPLPHVNGTDAWGTVAETGDGVDGWEIGDRVVELEAIAFAFGRLEFGRRPPAERRLVGRLFRRLRQAGGERHPRQLSRGGDDAAVAAAARDPE